MEAHLLSPDARICQFSRARINNIIFAIISAVRMKTVATSDSQVEWEEVSLIFQCLKKKEKRNE